MGTSNLYQVRLWCKVGCEGLVQGRRARILPLQLTLKLDVQPLEYWSSPTPLAVKFSSWQRRIEPLDIVCNKQGDCSLQIVELLTAANAEHGDD